MPKQTTDHYDFYPDHVIVHSKSGNTYFINSNLECNCVGYGYRQECRHTQYVKEHSSLPIGMSSKEMEEWLPSPVQQSILDQLTKGRS